MAKKRRRRSGFNYQSIFKLIKIGALVGPAIGEALRWKDQPEEILPQGLRLYTGYYYPRGEFRVEWLMQGWTPFIVASIMGAIVPKITGLIRRL